MPKGKKENRPQISRKEEKNESKISRNNSNERWICIYVPMKDGFAFMHRVGVQNHPIGDYYTFPGGGQEEKETLEEGTIREIKEEFGIDVEVVEKLYEMENGEKNQKEYFYLCKYIGGKFGTGQGPEFSGDPKYAHRGKYIPEIVKREDIEKITLLPYEIRDKFIKDMKNGRF